MSSQTTRGKEYSQRAGTVYLAFELGNTEWKLAFTVGLGQKPRERTIPAGEVGRLVEEIERAKQRFGLASSARVVSCYEAGRDGFWLHRFLGEVGVESLIVDSSSIEVQRRGRRVKTDRLDARKLVTMLIRYDGGERKVWSVVRVPALEEEENRQLHRELGELKRERTRLTNRIKGLLVGQGIRIELKRDFVERLGATQMWDGSPVPAALRCRLLREWTRVELINRQIRELEDDREELVREWDSPEVEKVRRLMQLRGIGINFSWLLVMEFFGWRRFRNRRQVGSLAGLVPTPYQSGASSREAGISKAGNVWVRAVAIEMAWAWLRFQPRSELARWYRERYAQGGSRMRRIGIVAVARKLLVDLWRHLDWGVIPAGAALKA